MRGTGIIVAGFIAALVGAAQAQSIAEDPQPLTASEILRGKPFAAIEYVRRVRILPDGTEQFLRNETYPKLLARDTAGRVRMDVVPVPDAHCDTPKEANPLPCSVASVVLFDPAAGTITHWPEGERAGHVAARIPVPSEQVEEAERSTYELPVDSRMPHDDTGATVESLGEKTIEGVRATGIRVTRSASAVDAAGNTVRRKDIHEVWTSAEMHLVLRVIDGDPQGEETVRELKHLSLSPDPALFEPPEGYAVETRDQPGDSRFAAEDMEFLESWFLTAKQ